MTDTIWAWSQTAADNGAADGTINWAEFQTPSSVNDSARAMMRRIAQLMADLAPRRTSTGSGNAYAVASTSTGVTLRDGQQITFIPHANNTSGCTLNVGGTGALPWRPKTSTSFVADNIISGVPVTAYYSSATSEWLSPGTGYYINSAASGVSLQSITARLPQIGDLVISYAPTPGPGRIRLRETTQSYSKAAYPELNAYLASISYPWGSDATNFNLPPAAGYFLRFAATTTAIDTGGARTAGSTQADGLLGHTHSLTISGTTSSNGDHSHTVAISQSSAANAGAGVAGSGTGPISTSTTGAHTHTFAWAGNTDLVSGGIAENRVKNVAFHLDVVASTALSAAQVAVFGFPFLWDTGTLAANPGAGRIRGNNATLTAVTALYVSNTDGWGVDISAVYASLDDGNRIILSKVGAQANRVVMRLTAAPTAGSGFYTIPVTVDVAAGALSSNDQLAFEYSGGGPQGDPGPTGSTGPNTALDYAWATATSGDPGTGKILANNATLSSATAIHISKTDRNGASKGGYIATWDDSTSTVKGHVRIFTVADPTEFIEADVTAIADNSTYYTLSVTMLSAAGTPTANDVMAVDFSRTGDKGVDGAGAGDVVGPASSTDNAVVRYDSTTGKAVQNSVVTVSDTGEVAGVSAIVVADGAEVTPSITHTGDTNTGFWFSAADTINASTSGVERFEMSASGTFGFNIAAQAVSASIIRIDQPTGNTANDTRVTISNTAGNRAALTQSNSSNHITMAMGSPSVATLGDRWGLGMSGSGEYAISVEHNGFPSTYHRNVGVHVNATTARQPFTVGESEATTATGQMVGIYKAGETTATLRNTSDNIEAIIGVSTATAFVGSVSAHELQFYVANSPLLRFSGSVLRPESDGTVALGSSTHQFNGLHLNSATAISWENGNITLTHSTGALTLGGGPLLLPSATLSIGTTTTPADLTVYTADQEIARFLTSDALGYLAMYNSNGANSLIIGGNSTVAFFQNTTGTEIEMQVAGGGATARLRAGEVSSGADSGGKTGFTTITSTNSLAARSTGVGTIKFADATARDSVGTIRIYIGTTAYRIPIFADAGA
jgi:hypothetical protein